MKTSIIGKLKKRKGKRGRKVDQVDGKGKGVLIKKGAMDSERLDGKGRKGQ